MNHFAIAAALSICLVGCSPEPSETEEAPANVLELEVQGLAFVGPDTIKSGWTTIRVANNSGMTHHALVYRLPDGVSAEMVDEQIVVPIQQSLTAAIAGDVDKAAEIAATMPSWVGD